jgi:hypothetical protein
MVPTQTMGIIRLTPVAQWLVVMAANVGTGCKFTAAQHTAYCGNILAFAVASSPDHGQSKGASQALRPGNIEPLPVAQAPQPSGVCGLRAVASNDRNLGNGNYTIDRHFATLGYLASRCLILSATISWYAVSKAIFFSAGVLLLSRFIAAFHA